MKQGTQDRTSTHKVPLGRMAGAIVALGGLSGLVLAEGTAGAATKVVVSTTKNPKLGTILVSGKTLYTLKASKTACSTACLKVWPALDAAQRCDEGHGWERCERFEARHRQAEQWRPPGDLCRQAALLLRRRHGVPARCMET